MSLLNKREIAEIKKILATPKRIIIVTHRNPDGDAMGSALGMYHYLKQTDHQVQVITPNDYPSFLHWLPGNEDVIEYRKKSENGKEYLSMAEVIFCLDFTDLNRIEPMGELVASSKATKIHIDHHQQPGDFADYLISDNKRASTAELVYEFMVLLHGKEIIEKQIATCLYVGVMTDTASFRFSNTTSETHRIVAELIDRGADNAKIFDRIYENNAEHRIRLLGYCINQKLTVFKEYHTAIIVVTQQELRKFNTKKGDTEGFVNYALGVEDVTFAAFFAEREDRVKVSFRSKGNFNVNEFAKKHFNGGGHNNAAGGETHLSLEEATKRFVELLPHYKNEIDIAYQQENVNNLMV